MIHTHTKFYWALYAELSMSNEPTKKDAPDTEPIEALSPNIPSPPSSLGR